MTIAELPPGAEQVEPPTVDTIEPEAEVVCEQESVSVVKRTLTVRLPVVEGFSGYSRRRVDVKFSRQQADFWRQLTTGLQESDAKLQSGKFVQSPSDAIKWVAENAAS